jgi:hypothetical protein
MRILDLCYPRKSAVSLFSLAPAGTEQHLPLRRDAEVVEEE